MKKLSDLICFFLTKKTNKRENKMKFIDGSAKMLAAIQEKNANIFQADDLSALAKESKFIQRSTNLLQAIDFVNLMVASCIDPKVLSLESLCSTLRELNPKADLTKQSLMEKINQVSAVVFLKNIFERTLHYSITKIIGNLQPDLFNNFNNVFLEDCTECKLNEQLQVEFKGSGGSASKSSVKLDFIYELKRKNIVKIELTDRRTPDQKLSQNNLEIINQGDLIIRDLGFFDIEVMQIINERGAFFLSRLHASANVFLNKEDTEPLDLAKYINKKFPNCSVIDILVYVTNLKAPVRLLAYRAPQQLADKRRREANKEAKKKRRTPKKATMNRLDFTIFITNIPKEVWKAEVVGTVYSVRWQIELIFKNWKSSLHIHYLKGINPHRIRCLLYAKLISIVIINMIYKFSSWYAEQFEKELSLHKLVNWLKIKNRLCEIILNGFNEAMFNSLLREIPKTMCKDKRERKTILEAIKAGVHYSDLYAN
jgi:hypothetical protein